MPGVPDRLPCISDAGVTCKSQIQKGDRQIELADLPRLCDPVGQLVGGVAADPEPTQLPPEIVPGLPDTLPGAQPDPYVPPTTAFRESTSSRIGLRDVTLTPGSLASTAHTAENLWTLSSFSSSALAGSPNTR